jgi:hypothetical protein
MWFKTTVHNSADGNIASFSAAAYHIHRVMDNVQRPQRLRDEYRNVAL